MAALFLFLVQYQKWIYGILGLILLVYLKKLIDATQDWNATIFGLEREYAQKRVNSALVMVIVAVLLLVTEFIAVNYLISDLPTIDPLTGDIVLAPETDMDIVEGEGVVSVGEDGAIATGYNGGCAIGVLEWISPQSSEVIKGLYTLKATVNVPEMGFFKYDYAPIADQTNWNAISAGNLPVIEGELGLLATTEIPNGDYVLRLEVVDKTNKPWAPCDVAIRILNE